MFDLFDKIKSKLPSYNERFSPSYDLKILPFSIASSSSTPSSDCAYSALPDSQGDDGEHSLTDSPTGRQRSLATLEELEASFTSPPRGYARLLQAFRKQGRDSSRRCHLLSFALLILLLSYMLCYSAFRPPNYIILPPEEYVDTLNATLNACLIKTETREALLHQLQQFPSNKPKLIRDASTESVSPINKSLIPATIWSSDKKAPPGSWAAKWKEMGFDPNFLDDAAAEAWVASNWAGTPVKQVWDNMPRFILKVDLLRYLLVLLEGGTWSDMDTVPLMHRQDWANNAVPISALLDPTSSSNTTEPVRFVVGIENDPNENYYFRNVLERWRLLPLNRHRPMQFVQWTLHGAPNHPILLDVVRRVLQASSVYQAHVIEWQREAQAEGWGWKEEADSYRQAQADARERPMSSPWEHARYSWKWQAGRWRLGWNTLSVEEWTGPAVFTDATFSYLFAAAGVRPGDLTLLKHPVQIRDVVIVPSLGFNPRNNRIKGVSRLVHLFRGSWKG